MKKYDVCICEDNDISLMVKVCNTIQEASEWLQCSVRTLYNTQHLYGTMRYGGYIVELVERVE